MNIVKKVRQGEMLPAWYGCAWREWEMDRMVCLPIGLNVLCALMRRIYHLVKMGGISVPVDPRDAYAQGLRDGKRSP
jgi:hypothetical protein